MSEIGPISNSYGPVSGNGNGKAHTGPAATPSPRIADDQVQVSEAARLLGQLASATGPATVDKVGTAAALIEAGFYDQPEVIDATIEAMLEKLDS